MNKTTGRILDILLYIIVFFVIQYIVYVGTGALEDWQNGSSMATFMDHFARGTFELAGRLKVVMVVLSSVATLLVFVYTRWAPVSRVWLASHPWTVLCWVVWLALGTILPSEWLNEQLNLTMPESAVKMFEAIMGEPAGYVAIGILAPVAEELVFRGAVLRTLLGLFDRRLHWIPILISAMLFGAVHLNWPQFVHATLIGLLLGWLYYRTDSVAPGIVFHWINNTVAYLMFNLMPQMADGKLIDLFRGQASSMWMGLLFSLCIVMPSVFQLNLRLRRN